jgi:alpha-N-acetylglucosamine transferase
VWFNLPQLWDWKSVRVIHYQYEKPWEENHPKRDLLKPLIDLWWGVLEHGTIPDHLPPPDENPHASKP